MNVRKQIDTARALAAALGPDGIVQRAGYEFRKRSGLLERRLPVSTWDDLHFERLLARPELADPAGYLLYRRTSAPAFLFDPSEWAVHRDLLRSWDSEDRNPVDEANLILDGRFRFFSYHLVDLGLDPEWNRNAFTGSTLPADRHWSTIPDFGGDDVKVTWEPSRFAWVYPLVRAYWRTGDERYPERFWELVESWRTGNQPNAGPNWKCAQETSLRLIAWCVGLYGFLHATATTADRVVKLSTMIAQSGYRIAATTEYGLSQKNNHGVSEGMGLWTIGLLFPEFKRASEWRRRGEAILEQVARSLFDDDGAFSQHSTNYQRLALHDYLWSMRLAEANGRAFSALLRERVIRSAELLFQVQDHLSGQVPRLGPDDGARIIQFDNTDYRDFRSIVEGVRFLASGNGTYENGPWTESLFWLFGPGAIAADRSAPERRDLSCPGSGYFALRSANGFAFIRAPRRFRHRPSHADSLHVDLWWNGVNIAQDPGTYSYHAPAPWNTGLADTSVHNTVTVDGLNQMDRAGRFLWYPWMSGTTQQINKTSSTDGGVTWWEGAHNGYERLDAPVSCRRAVARIGLDHWIVIDRLQSFSDHEYELRWLLPPDNDHGNGILLGPRYGEWLTVIDANGQCLHATIATTFQYAVATAVQAAPDSCDGWISPYYLHREPARSIAVKARGAHGLFVTAFGQSETRLAIRNGVIAVDSADWSAEIDAAINGESRLIEHARINHAAGDMAIRQSLEARKTT